MFFISSPPSAFFDVFYYTLNSRYGQEALSENEHLYMNVMKIYQAETVDINGGSVV